MKAACGIWAKPTPHKLLRLFKWKSITTQNTYLSIVQKMVNALFSMKSWENLSILANSTIKYIPLILKKTIINIYRGLISMISWIQLNHSGKRYLMFSWTLNKKSLILTTKDLCLNLKIKVYQYVSLLGGLLSIVAAISFIIIRIVWSILWEPILLFNS